MILGDALTDLVESILSPALGGCAICLWLAQAAVHSSDKWHQH